MVEDFLEKDEAGNRGEEMKSIDTDWRFTASSVDGQSLLIDGIDVWKYDWQDTKERVVVTDPSYHQEFTFYVFRFTTKDELCGSLLASSRTAFGDSINSHELLFSYFRTSEARDRRVRDRSESGPLGRRLV